MNNILTTLRFMILSIVICSVAYPATMLAFGRVFVSWKADGSMLTNDHGRIIGSMQIAQSFTRPEYFWPRPSAVNYDASATGGSNLSPGNPEVGQRARDIIARYGLNEDQRIPADLVTASGSGMDPHITLDAALLQLPRVAAARAVPASEIEPLIAQNLDATILRIFGGEPVVNVLKLNLALDALTDSRGQ